MKQILVGVCLAVAILGQFAANARTEPVRPAAAKKGLLILYNGARFQGDFMEISKARTSIATDMPVGSIAVYPGEAWEICEKPRFKAPCRIVRDSETGLGGIMVRSARPAPVAPPPAP